MMSGFNPRRGQQGRIPIGDVHHGLLLNQTLPVFVEEAPGDKGWSPYPALKRRGFEAPQRMVVPAAIFPAIIGYKLWT